MSDYKDVIKKAIEKGFSLDTCGTDERHYSWGLYSDFCGMSVEDAKEAPNAGMGGGGGSSKKTNNNVSFIMEETTTPGEYALTLSATYAPSSPVTVTFTMDGTPQTVVIPAGEKVVKTGLQANDGYKYATITNISFSNDDEYTFVGKNQVATGYFTLTISQGSESAVYSVKYGESVTLPTVPAKEGYDYIWKDQNGNIISGSTFTMPESTTTITGNYVAKTYVLTYTIFEEEMSGHTKSSKTIETGTIEVEYGTVILPLVASKIVSKEGYTASPWVTDGATIITSATTMPAYDLNINAIYELKQYTITYNADNTLYTSQTLYFTEVIDDVDNPEKEGYSFKNWDGIIPSVMPATNLVVNAVFEINQYTVTVMLSEIYFDPNNYTAQTEYVNYSSITLDYNAKILQSLPEMPSKIGSTFTGWGIINGEDIIPLDDNATMPAEDLVFYGIYKLNLHDVNYYIDNVKYDMRSCYWYGQSTENDWAFRPEGEQAASKEGYDLKGWYIDDDINRKFEVMPMPDEDLNVYTKYDVHTFSVYYMVNGEIFEKYDNVEYHSIIPSSQNIPQIAGYTFNKWIGTSGETIGGLMPDNDVVFNADISINVYDLVWRFVDDNSALIEEIVQQYNYGTEITESIYDNVKSEFINKGHESIGHNFINSAILPFTLESSTTVNVTYSTTYYDLSWIFEDEDGATIYTQYDIASYGESLNERYNEVISTFYETYEHTGHDIEVIEGDPTKTMPAENLTIKMQYKTLSYKFGYYNFNGDLVETIDVKYNSSINYPTEETVVGYTFDKWVEYGTENEGLLIMPARDYYVSPKYNVNVHTISFLNEDLTPYATYTKNYGDYIQEIIDTHRSEMPVKQGYTGQWDIDLDTLPSYMPDYDITATIVFTLNQYEVQFYDDNDNLIQTNFVYYGDAIPFPIVPEKAGYEFDKWIDMNTLEDAPTIMPDKNISVKEKFNILSYELQWEVYDEYGTMKFYESAMTEYGALITPPTIEISGYTFNGWDTEVPSTMPNYSLTISGTCTATLYSLIYIVDSEEYETEQHHYGDAITLLPNPTKDGYTFSGWNPQPTTMPAEDVNIYGSFIAIDYTLTINAYDADGVKISEYSSVVENLHVGDNISAYIPTPAPIEGYVFVWDTTIPTTMPASNLTIEGRYAEESVVSTVYYSAVYENDIVGLTSNDILSMPNFEPTTEVTNCTDPIPADAQVIEWAELAEQAYDEGNDDEGDAYNDMITEYQELNKVGNIIIIPETVTNYNYSDDEGKVMPLSLVKTIVINGCTYNIYKDTDSITDPTGDIQYNQRRFNLK